MGAGGTNGGMNRFIIGIIMTIAGGYLLLNSIHVSNSFHLGYSSFNLGGMRLTSGFVMIPFIFGVGMLFYNYKSPWGWVLTGGSIVLLVFGVITSIQFTMHHMTAFELILILTLLVGGIGLFLSSFRNFG